MTKQTIEPERSLTNQRFYRFDNGYGASVISDGHGSADGPYELLVIRWNGPRNWTIATTPIAMDALGWLSEDDVQRVLADIRALPAGAVTT